MPPRLGVLLAILFWGVSFVATKAVVREIHASTLVFSRAGLGTAFLTGLLALRGHRILPPRREWRALAVMGVVGVSFHQLLQAVALTMTSAVNTGWLIGLTPIWSALLAVFMLRERMNAGKIVGLVAGFIGAALVVTHGRIDAAIFTRSATHGDLLILASTLNWAIYTVLGHPTIRRLGPMRATSGSVLFGWIALAPLFVATGGWRDYAQLSAGGWGALLFLGVACSGLGYLFWYGALERIEVSRVAAFLYVEPLVTLGAAVLLLGEHVRLVTVAGGLLLLSGVVIVQRAPMSPERRERGNGRPRAI